MGNTQIVSTFGFEDMIFQGDAKLIELLGECFSKNISNITRLLARHEELNYLTLREKITSDERVMYIAVTDGMLQTAGENKHYELSKVWEQFRMYIDTINLVVSDIEKQGLATILTNRKDIHDEHMYTAVLNLVQSFTLFSFDEDKLSELFEERYFTITEVGLDNGTPTEKFKNLLGKRDYVLNTLSKDLQDLRARIPSKKG